MIPVRVGGFLQENCVRVVLIYGGVGVSISLLLRWWGLTIPTFCAATFLVLGGIGTTPILDTIYLLFGRTNDEYDPAPLEASGIYQGITVLLLSAIAVLPGFTWGLILVAILPGIVLSLVPKWEELIYDNFIGMLLISVAHIIANAVVLGYI